MWRRLKLSLMLLHTCMEPHTARNPPSSVRAAWSRSRNLCRLQKEREMKKETEAINHCRTSNDKIRHVAFSSKTAQMERCLIWTPHVKRSKLRILFFFFFFFHSREPSSRVRLSIIMVSRMTIPKHFPTGRKCRRDWEPEFLFAAWNDGASGRNVVCVRKTMKNELSEEAGGWMRIVPWISLMRSVFWCTLCFRINCSR